MSALGYPPPDDPLALTYDAAYATVPNWDIGRPQRAFVAAADAGLVGERVLDVGCGTGELALYLARLGHDVLGVDVSSRAIAQAREKAHWRRIPAKFLVWDARALHELSGAGVVADTVTDCAMSHVLWPSERDRFVAGLEAVLDPGGTYLCLGDVRRDSGSTYGVTVEELRGRFAAPAWELSFVRPTVFERRGGGSPALFACAVRQ